MTLQSRSTGALLSVLLALSAVGCGPSKPKETEGHKRMREEQELIKKERELQAEVAKASGTEKAELEAELASVSARLDEFEAEKEERTAKKAAADAEARRPENRIVRDMKATKLNCATAAQNVASLSGWDTDRRRNYIDVCTANTMIPDKAKRDAQREFYTCAQVAKSKDEILSLCQRYRP